jgi:hypothetical protein
LPLQAGAVEITPAAGVVVLHLAAAAFREANAGNAGFAVLGRATRATFTFPFATLTVSRDFLTGGGAHITPAAEIGYGEDDAASGISQTLVAQDGTVFAGNRTGLSRNGALVGASLSAGQRNWAGFVSYRASFAGAWRAQSLQAGLSWKF